MKRLFLVVPMLLAVSLAAAQQHSQKYRAIDLADFQDCAHHWYDINDDAKVIEPLPNRPKHDPSDIVAIADNILLFQKTNGGWPKNYDMCAILTDEQRVAVRKEQSTLNTTIDNDATYSHVRYLSEAYTETNDDRYKEACLRGLEYMLSAQYPNGGWPQFFPDTSGYRKYITFNDGAMVGVMRVLYQIVSQKPQYAFVDKARRDQIKKAYEKGLDCIVRCQIMEKGRLTAWCQQHDNADLRPQNARTFELASICTLESAELVEFLMSIDRPRAEVVTAVQSAVKWFASSKIFGIRVKVVKAPTVTYQYHTTSIDRVVVQDPKAPPIWARFYELGTQRPLFCNRDGKAVYSLAEVARERRTGYGWYNNEPAKVIKKYSSWQKRWAPKENVLGWMERK